MIKRRITAIFLAFFCITSIVYAQENDSSFEKNINAPSAILIEQTTGQVLFEKDADKKMNIASVTKTMTMLLITEALDSGKIGYSDMVTVSEYAASMGGSQIFLEVGEQMSVDDLLKAIAVSSGNDAAVAMAEYISGSEEAFVEQMNRRAYEIGAKNTHFINCNGLDETDEHYSTARDIAIISAELLRHSDIEKYLTIWMDSLRNGSFGLSNTNKLIRFYNGANGIKTGHTDIAKYCLSASAKRDNLQLIAVVLGSPNSSDRFNSASKLLDYGFANYAMADNSSYTVKIPKIAVEGGVSDSIEAEIGGGLNAVVKKGSQNKITVKVKTKDKLTAPVKKGDKVGEAVFYADGKELTRRTVIAGEDSEKIGFLKILEKNFKKWATLY